VEVLKQPQYNPLPVEDQVLILYMLTQKYFSGINVERIGRTESDFLKFIRETQPEIQTEIRDTKEISTELEEKLKTVIDAFLKQNEN